MARKGERAPELKHRAAVLLAAGMAKAEIAAELGIARQTLWAWETQDPELAEARTRLTDAVVRAAHQDFRALARKTVEAIDRGLGATHRQQVVATGEGTFQIVDLRDDSLAVRTAEAAMRHLPEWNVKGEVELSASSQLVDLIRRLDAREESGGRDADAGTPADAAHRRPDIRPNESEDTHEADPG